MSTLYPAAADDNTTLPNPTASSATNSPSLSGAQANQNDAIKAIEAKLGTGASTPTSNTLMYGNGTGTSAWTQLTSSQLASSLSDETGTGKAVFGTTPTLITPAVDTINESTPGNGVTMAGMNVKSGVIQTSGAVTTAVLAASSVTNAKLSTTAGELGGAWQSWTPTWTGSTIGNSTVVAKSIQIGKIVHFHMAVTLGSTFVMAVGTDTTFTLPVISVSSGYSQYVSVIGRAASLHTGTSQFGGVAWNSTTTALLQAEKIVSSTNVATAWSTTNVGTSAGDTWGITGSYEAA